MVHAPERRDQPWWEASGPVLGKLYFRDTQSYTGEMNISPNALDITYSAPNDVPVPLRAMLRQAYESGLTTKQLATIYEMPESWLQLFVWDAKGRS